MFNILLDDGKPRIGHNVTTPSIYAVELTAACDLACPMCFRTTSALPDKKPKLFDVQLLVEMIRRGDFEGSSYVELQMAGEPTIHPELDTIIRLLKVEAGVLVGLSTHGHNMQKVTRSGATVGEVLMSADYVTISVDSLDSEVYHRMRYPKFLPELLDNLSYFHMLLAGRSNWPVVDLQVVKAENVAGSGDVAALENYVQEKNFHRYSVRSVEDSFVEMRDEKVEGSVARTMGVCLNPFVSVNVTQDGDVVSCCYVFHTHDPASGGKSANYYGNLNEQSLKDIWANERVAAMQQSQVSQTPLGLCRKCYMLSPYLLHQRIVSNIVRRRRRG